MDKLPKKIIIASNNQGKIREITDLLADLDVEAITPKSLDAFANFTEPDETGDDFETNSLIKAKFYAEKSGLVSLADDSGFCVNDLDGRPGVHSARFALDKNGEKNFAKAFEKIFNQLQEKNKSPDKEQLKSHFICNLSIYDPNDKFHTSFEGRVNGHLSRPKGANGFGFDPIFIKEGMNQTFGEIDPDLKNNISHRAMAFKKLTDWLKTIKN